MTDHRKTTIVQTLLFWTILTETHYSLLFTRKQYVTVKLAILRGNWSLLSKLQSQALWRYNQLFHHMASPWSTTKVFKITIIFYSAPFFIVTNQSSKPTFNRSVPKHSVKLAFRPSEKYLEEVQPINMKRFGKTFWFFTFGFFFNNCAFNVLAQLQVWVQSWITTTKVGHQGFKERLKPIKVIDKSSNWANYNVNTICQFNSCLPHYCSYSFQFNQ